MSSTGIQRFIDAAIEEIEWRLGIFIKPYVIKSDTVGLVEGTDYDLEESPYDYVWEQYRQWGFVQLRERPVISIERVQLKLPNYQTVVDFDLDWIKLHPAVGQIRIVPYAGSPSVMSVAGGSGSSFPFLTGQFARNIPQAIWVDYTAGLRTVPADIHNIVAKLAAIDILGIAGDAILAGVASQSTSIDGLSESFSTTASATNATYGARILQYKSEVSDFFGESGGKGERGSGAGGARSRYRGITMTVL